MHLSENEGIEGSTFLVTGGLGFVGSALCLELVRARFGRLTFGALCRGPMILRTKEFTVSKGSSSDFCRYIPWKDGHPTAAGHSEFVNDGCPVNSFEFLRPLLRSLDYDLPKASLSVPSALFLSRIICMIYTLLYPWLNRWWLPQPLILPVEVYKATYAWHLARRVDPANACARFWQTFALGIFSLRLLLMRAQKQGHASSPCADSTFQRCVIYSR